MKKILVINGANLNMVGIREKTVYGEKTYRDLVEFIKKSAKERGLKVKIFQSNHEGEIVDEIQRAYRRYDGIIINAGGYTHTSVVIMTKTRLKTSNNFLFIFSPRALFESAIFSLYRKFYGNPTLPEIFRYRYSAINADAFETTV